MTENKPVVSSGGGLSTIWIIPILAVGLGIWMVLYSFMNEGPELEISFNNADGLTAGKTKLKYLSVDIGQVESVTLNADASGVIVTAKLEKVHEDLLKDDTRFWVEKARIGAGGVTGLSTILSGAYIKLAPGKKDLAGSAKYVGLEVPPLTEVGAPGARLVIEAESASSISVGDSVLYHDYVVGRVESMEFDHKKEKISYGVFIDAPYHKLLNTSVRFWNISGFSLTASAEGVSLDTGSLETILSGGISFGVPEGMPVGSTVKDGTIFTLYSNYSDTLEEAYKYGEYFVVSFKQNLAGLVPGAPVQYRGITIGRVERVLLKEMVSQGTRTMGSAIPVLIYLEPGRLEIGDNSEGKKQLISIVKKGVEGGLRATLASGNLLTGSLLVSLDYFPDEEKAELGSFNQYQVIPSISGGLEQIQHSIAQFLKKLNSLPLENIASTSGEALASLNVLLSSEEIKNIPIQLSDAVTAMNAQKIPEKLASALDSLKLTLDGLAPGSPVYNDLDNTLYELNDALQGVEELTQSLSNVSSVLPSSEVIDPEPEVAK